MKIGDFVIIKSCGYCLCGEFKNGCAGQLGKIKTIADKTLGLSPYKILFLERGKGHCRICHFTKNELEPLKSKFVKELYE